MINDILYSIYNVLFTLLTPINRKIVRSISRYYRANKLSEISDSHLRFVSLKHSISIYIVFPLLCLYFLFSRGTGNVFFADVILLAIVFLCIALLHFRGVKIQIVRMDAFILERPMSAHFVKFVIFNKRQHINIRAAYQEGGGATQINLRASKAWLNLFKKHQNEGSSIPSFNIWIDKSFPNWTVSEVDEDFGVITGDELRLRIF